MHEIYVQYMKSSSINSLNQARSSKIHIYFGGGSSPPPPSTSLHFSCNHLLVISLFLGGVQLPPLPPYTIYDSATLYFHSESERFIWMHSRHCEPSCSFVCSSAYNTVIITIRSTVHFHFGFNTVRDFSLIFGTWRTLRMTS